MTLEAECVPRGARVPIYLNAEKRLSNEFDCSTGEAPATSVLVFGWLGAVVAAVVAGALAACGLNGGCAAACLVSLGRVSTGLAATAFGAAGLLSTGFEVAAVALAATAPLAPILRKLDIRLDFSGALTAATRGVVEPTEAGSGAAATAVSSAFGARGGLT